jgi:hypothetical protein
LVVVSVVAAAPEPTAVQTDAEGHETPYKAVTSNGKLWAVQVLPPSVVATMEAPWIPLPKAPTAVQSAALEQEMSSREPNPEA